MSIPLEDQFNDVLMKASRGLGRAPAELSAATGISPEKIRRVMEGAFDAGVVRAIAAPLGLAAERLVALGEKSYEPAAIAIEGLAGFNTSFDDMRVNAYLVWDPIGRSAAVFDTGSDAGEILAKADELGVRVEQVFVTHSHGDHIYDFDRLIEKTGARGWAPERDEVEGAQTFMAGTTFAIGGLVVGTRLTWGHARGGVTYVVHGLERPVAICGDALFAGSMGGGAVSYPDALRTNREEIFALPAETVIAPGHGPLTTVGEERLHNPFFPELS